MAEAFWDYAVGIYGLPGVSETCIQLQDEQGADVNLLLAAAWLSACSRCWDMTLVQTLCATSAPWREQVIEPLRRARREFKASAPDLYAAAKRLELEAEQVQIQLLEQQLETSVLISTVEGALDENLRVYRRVLGENQPLELWLMLQAHLENAHTRP